ncbi:MAG TPA: glycosyltransferase family 4 protein [Candidatus Binataceae bacterium]|nr:glycosyltransferase family 4 protein [Candidatus Binataceae bacterium]
MGGQPRFSFLYVGALPPHRGGSAIVGENLLTGLARAGHKVCALAPVSDSDADTPDDFARAHPEISLTRYRVPFYSTARSESSTNSEYIACERAGIESLLPSMISQSVPDLLIIGRERIAQQIPADICRLLPSVAILHGGNTFERLRRGMCEEVELAAALKKVDLLVGVAEHVTASLRAVGFGDVTTIPNGVDTRRFAPRAKDPELMRSMRINGSDIVAVHVSKLAGVKRPRDLIESARVAIHENPRLIYLVIGDGPCRADMEQRCAALGLTDRFRYTGWISHQEIPRYLNLADIVVMPSESEGQCLVCLEAMACAKAVITTDIAGSREIIADRETGVLVDVGDVRELARATAWLAAHPQVRDEIGKRARIAADEHADDRVNAEYERQLIAVIERHRAASRVG